MATIPPIPKAVNAALKLGHQKFCSTPSGSYQNFYYFSTGLHRWLLTLKPSGLLPSLLPTCVLAVAKGREKPNVVIVRAFELSILVQLYNTTKSCLFHATNWNTPVICPARACFCFGVVSLLPDLGSWLLTIGYRLPTNGCSCQCLK